MFILALKFQDFNANERLRVERQIGLCTQVDSSSNLNGDENLSRKIVVVLLANEFNFSGT